MRNRPRASVQRSSRLPEFEPVATRRQSAVANVSAQEDSMTVRRSLAAAICGLILAACGSSSSSPTPSVPQYGGSWSGTYVISGCNQTGGMSLVNICGSLGNSAPYGLTLTQNGTSVTGSFALGTITFANNSRQGRERNASAVIA
jgi:hypothetical protein